MSMHSHAGAWEREKPANRRKTWEEAVTNLLRSTCYTLWYVLYHIGFRFLLVQKLLKYNEYAFPRGSVGTRNIGFRFLLAQKLLKYNEYAFPRRSVGTRNEYTTRNFAIHIIYLSSFLKAWPPAGPPEAWFFVVVSNCFGSTYIHRDQEFCN